jgi:YVTN family beta-propeller protein
MTLPGKHIGAAVVLLVVAGCAPTRLGTQADRSAPPSGGGGLYVFFHEPAPPSIAFEVSEAAAIREDGGSAPLRIAEPPRRGRPGPPERLWLSGSVPPGAYIGLRLSFSSASRVTPEGSTTLEVPSGPVDLPFPVTVAHDAAVVLTAELRATTEPGGAARFNPEFVLAPPGRVTTGLLGVATVKGWQAATLFDKRTGRITSIIPVGRAPAGLAIDPERVRAYVTVSGDDAVAVLDLVEARVRERVELRSGDAPRDAVLSLDGRMLIVANSGSDTISFVDTAAAVETERLAVGSQPVDLVITRDGRRVFVVAERGSAVTVVDVTSRAVVGTIATDTAPVQARLGGRADELLYVAHEWSPNLLVADTSSLATLRRIFVGNGARALEVERQTGRIFLARRGTGRIEIFDPFSLLPIDEIPVRGDVTYLALEREGNALGVVLGEAREVDLVGVVGRKVLTRTALGPDPAALGFLEAR